MTFIDTIQDVQTRSIEQLKSAQEQILGYNEQLASTLTEAMPEVPELPGPLANMPRPTELVESYYSFLGSLYEANKEFTLRMLAPWDKAEPEAKAKAKPASK